MGHVTELRVAEAVCKAFPGFLIAAVVADGLDGHTPWPEAAAGLAALEADPPPEDDPHIVSWREAYRAFSTNPKRQRPSVDALRRRLARNGRLPRISPLVDGYNVVSATYAVPVGAFDLLTVAGDIEVRFADGNEDFTPLGEPDVVEHPNPGEVIYHDAKSVLTRHWNYRDADRTKVTEASTDVVFLLETTESATFGDLVRQAAADLAARLDSRATAVTVHWLSPAAPLHGGQCLHPASPVLPAAQSRLRPEAGPGRAAREVGVLPEVECDERLGALCGDVSDAHRIPGVVLLSPHGRRAEGLDDIGDDPSRRWQSTAGHRGAGRSIPYR
jgi:DNA/RNA-binding domain of Phe-tRNA-synthetase-like protein